MVTNQTIIPTETERERRTQASAANHGALPLLDAERSHVVGAPEITHQTTADPYTADPAPVDPAGIQAANRPPVAQPPRARPGAPCCLPCSCSVPQSG